MAVRCDYELQSYKPAVGWVLPTWKVIHMPTGEIVFEGQCTRPRVELEIKLDMD